MTEERIDMIPGELFIQDGELELNAGRKTVTLSVANTGDRPIQVGSHYHFFETNRALAFDRDKARGCRLDIPAGTAVRMQRGAYAAMFGPTVGDRIRLADTELFVEIESDRTIYGEEVKFGGGKVIRDGMGQSQATRAEGAVDTVITNAGILDHW